jgi:hypothetical protein
VDAKTPPDGIYLAWARSVKRHGLVGLALLFLDLLHMNRGLALPCVWMLAPFFKAHTLDPLENALVNPEILPSLRDYLVESEGSA